jgi:LmbE family N-acetylglucosaminyl deacetylase
MPRLLAILAHPDDESLGIGGLLAKCAADGAHTSILTATRGQRGRYFTNENRPSDAEVGQAREQELRAAAAELGVADVSLLDYMDGALDRADGAEAVERIVTHVRRVRPDVVVTFGMDGAYGHPDHIAICQLTNAALVAAADPSYGSGAAHRASKLYWFGNTAAKWELYQRAFKRLVSTVDGVERVAQPWPDWLPTTRVDARAHWRTVWRAVQQHRTQLAIYEGLEQLSAAQHEVMWGQQDLYRVYSLVNGGRAVEDDVFAGVD